MRFLADEGVDAAIVSAIRSEGHDVRWIAEELEGTTDDVVLDAVQWSGSSNPSGWDARNHAMQIDSRASSWVMDSPRAASR